MKRAKQTAKIAKELHPCAKFVEDPDLAEISWGEWEGTNSPLVSGLLSEWKDGDYKGFWRSDK